MIEIAHIDKWHFCIENFKASARGSECLKEVTRTKKNAEWWKEVKVKIGQGYDATNFLRYMRKKYGYKNKCIKKNSKKKQKSWKESE